MLSRQAPLLAVAMLSLAGCGPRGDQKPNQASKPAQSAIPQAAPAAGTASDADPHWLHFLPGLLPAIDACLGASPPRAMVTLAMPMNHGKALVRLSDADGLRSECVADIGTRHVEKLSSLAADAAPLPGENAPRFLRAPGLSFSVDGLGLPDAPIDPGQLAELRAPDGEIWGWTVRTVAN